MLLQSASITFLSLLQIYSSSCLVFLRGMPYTVMNIYIYMYMYTIVRLSCSLCSVQSENVDLHNKEVKLNNRCNCGSKKYKPMTKINVTGFKTTSICCNIRINNQNVSLIVWIKALKQSNVYQEIKK